MRKIIYLAAFVALAASTRADEKSSRLEFEKSSEQLAARLVLGEIRNELATNDIATAALFRAMMAHPESYQNRDAASAALKTNYVEAVTAEYRRRLVQLLDQMAKPQTSVEYFGASFVEKISSPDAAFLQGICQERYAPTFNAARKQACDEQAKHLASSIHPTEEEVDTIDHGRLVHEIAGRIIETRKDTLFDENRGYVVSCVAEPIYWEAIRQRDLQRDMLLSLPVNSYTPGFLTTNLLRSLQGAWPEVREQCRKEKGYGYGLFASVTNAHALAAKAQERAEKNFLDGIKSVPTNIFNRAALAAEFERKHEVHRLRGNSRNATALSVGSNLFNAVRDNLRRKVRNEESAAFNKYVEDVRTRGSIRNLQNRRFDAEFAPLFKEARGFCASNQMKRVFSAYFDNAWYPDADFVDFVYAHPDWSGVVSNWRNLAALKTTVDAEKNNPIIEETSAMLDGCMRRAITTGGTARDWQHGAVRDVYGMLSNEFAAKGRVPSLEEVLVRYREAVNERWQKRIPEALKDERAQIKYAPLFKSTEERIEQLSRVLIASLQNSNALTATPSAAGDLSADVLPLGVSIWFDYNEEGDTFTSTVRLNGSEIAKSECPAKPAKFRKELNGFVDRTSSPVIQTLRETVKKSRVDFRINIHVRNDLVYYSSVIKTFDRIRSEVERQGGAVNSFRATGVPRE